MQLGQVDAAGASAREALTLAESGTEPHWLALVELAFHAMHRDDADEAARLGYEALEEAEGLEDTSRLQAIGILATLLMGLDRTEEARSYSERFVHEARQNGLVAFESVGLADLGWIDLLDHDYESARAAFASALTQLRSHGDKSYEQETLRGLGLASLGLGQRGDARAAFADMLELALAATQAHSASVAEALSGTALAADPAAADRAAQLRGAVDELSSGSEIVMNAYYKVSELESQFERELVAVIGEEAWEREKLAGSTMTLEQAIELARGLFGDARE
jgi:tetratricopeptide (TPR) repeat protein